MKNELKEIIDTLNEDELYELENYVDARKKEITNSWNSKIEINSDVMDYQLAYILNSLGIKNMAEFKLNGLAGIPKEYHRMAKWYLRAYDFDSAELKYKNSRKNR